MKRRSLIGRLAFLVSLGFAAIWLLSMFVTGLALRSEQTELFDEEIDQIAHLFRPIVTQALNSGFLDAATINAALSTKPWCIRSCTSRKDRSSNRASTVLLMCRRER